MATNPEDIYSRSPGTAMAQAAQAATPRDATASTVGSEAMQAASASHTGYNAAQGTVADSELASTELNRITSQDSPIMQRAKAVAAEYANSRGLQNSSIAAGATMAAMADRALPVAQQDAAARRNQSILNQDATNRALEFGAAASNTAELQRAEQAGETARQTAALQTNVSLANADAANRAALQTAELQTNVALANASEENAMRREVVAQNAEINRQWLAGSQAQELAAIEGRYQQLMATNASASGLYQSYFQSISQLLANDQLPPDRVAQYVRTQQNMLEAGLRLIDSLNGVDMTIEPGGGGTAEATGYVPPQMIDSAGLTNWGQY